MKNKALRMSFSDFYKSLDSDGKKIFAERLDSSTAYLNIIVCKSAAPTLSLKMFRAAKLASYNIIDFDLTYEGD